MELIDKIISQTQAKIYLYISVSTDIEKLNNFSQELAAKLRGIIKGKNTFAEAIAQDFYSEEALPPQFVLLLTGMEVVLPKYKKNIIAFIGDRVFRKKLTLLPILNSSFLAPFIKDTLLETLIENYGVIINLDKKE